MAIAPLIVAVRTTGAASLARTSAQLRAMAAAVRSAAVRVAVAARTTSTYTSALGRLAAALRRVAVAALVAARAIGGPLVRAMRQAARAAFSLARTMALAAARMAAIWGPVVAGAIALVPAIVNLSGAVMLLAPAIIAAGSAFATWKLATRGFMDAVNADGAEELDAALKKLSPSARSAALTLRDLGREWKSTQQKVQEAFFKDARRDFITLSRAIQQVADVWLPKLAKSFADARMYIAQVIDAAAESGQLDRIMAGVHQFINGLLDAVPYLLRAFLDIAEVAAPSFGELGASIDDMARRFADWIRKLKDDGTLKAWIDRAKETFGQLKDIGKEIGRVFAAIFQGAEGNTFLENLRNSIREFADWLGSDNGQAVIHFFVDVAEAIANVIVWISNVVDWFQRGWDALRRDTEGLRNALAAAFGAIGAAAGMLFGIISGGAAAFGWIGAVISRMGGLVAAVRGAVSGINAALAAIRTSVFIDIITRRFDGGTQGYAKGMGSGGGGPPPKFYAKGGRVKAGVPVVVGDAGRPELFVPDSAGRIEPRVPAASPGGQATGGASWDGSMTGLDAIFFRWFNHAVRTGQLKPS